MTEAETVSETQNMYSKITQLLSRMNTIIRVISSVYSKHTFYVSDTVSASVIKEWCDVITE
jgi:hypothetical protein